MLQNLPVMETRGRGWDSLGSTDMATDTGYSNFQKYRLGVQQRIRQCFFFEKSEGSFIHPALPVQTLEKIYTFTNTYNTDSITNFICFNNILKPGGT